MIRARFMLPIAAALMVSACAEEPKEKSEASPLPVRVIEVRETAGTDVMNYVGTVAPSKSSVVFCAYPGTLDSLNVRQGSRVKKGEVVAVVRSQNVISMYETTQATLKQAEDGYARAKKVHGSGSIADVKMIEIETQLAQARAAAKAAEQALESCRIKAPFDATVSEILTEEGVELSISQPVARLFDISSVEIKFSVPENEIGQIDVGDRASVEVPALDMDGRKAVFEAEVSSKGIAASPLSHSYECTLVPGEDVPGLMPGMVSKVRLGRDGRAAIVIPASVVKMDSEGKYVWSVDGDGKVIKKYISASGFYGKGVIVSDGLESGDKVISDGGHKVSTGMKVSIIK